MPAADRKRILVVANRTAATPTLLNEVRRRVADGPCVFALIVPDAPRADHDWTLERALPLLEGAAHGHVKGLIGGPDPFEAVSSAVRDGHYDEVIVSTLPRRTSRRLRRDLPRRIEQIGVPVTIVVSPLPEKESMANTYRERPTSLRHQVSRRVAPRRGVRARSLRRTTDIHSPCRACAATGRRSSWSPHA